MEKPELYTCPCCGYKTLTEKPPGTYEICPICFWEDDPVQFNDPNYTGGANKVSLKEAQENFQLDGVSELNLAKFVREPRPDDIKDPNWKQIS